MDLQSPSALLFERINERLTATVPELRFIALDIGQLENYEIRPAVSWPCLLIDDDEVTFSDTAGNLQLADATLVLRLGLVKYTDINNLTPAAARVRGYEYKELEYKIFAALHGWEASGFGALKRRKAATERRDDDIRVRVMTYQVGYTDLGAAPRTVRIARPQPDLLQG